MLMCTFGCCYSFIPLNVLFKVYNFHVLSLIVFLSNCYVPDISHLYHDYNDLCCFSKILPLIVFHVVVFGGAFLFRQLRCHSNNILGQSLLNRDTRGLEETNQDSDQMTQKRRKKSHPLISGLQL